MRPGQIALLTCGAMCAPPAQAQVSEQETKALGVIVEFAKAMCGSVSVDRDKRHAEASIQAKAELPGVIKKLADIGVTAAAKYGNSKDSNVLADDLSKLVASNQEARACNRAIWDDFKSKLGIGARKTISGCPGDLLYGIHSPRGGHASWKWSIDNVKNSAEIWKPDSRVAGNAKMLCTGEAWTAQLYNMDHKVKYECRGGVSGSVIKDASCTTDHGQAIDVTGQFALQVQ